VSALLWGCFAVSGAAALALEMLWMRSAGVVLGETAATTGAVLGCYFAGLGLGAAAARGGSARPVRRYGRLELGVALGAAWSLGIFALLARDGGQRLLVALGTPGRIAVVAAALLPATSCLGATLPALGQALAGAGTAGRRGGLLYALNTLGAAVGAAATGFGLPALVGVRASYGLAAAASSLAGATALALGDRSAPPAGPLPGPRPVAARRRELRLVAAGVGFLGLALEVLWTRLFAQVLHNSVYSFTAVALVFLVAIAAGAGLAAVALRRRDPERVAAVALVVAGAATSAGFWTFVRWTDGLGYVGMRSGLAEYLGRIVALAAVTAGPGAFAAAAVLPATWAAWGAGDGTARPLGELSAANTIGAVAGAVLAAFVAVPCLGIRGSVLVAAVAYVVLADLVHPAGRSLRPWSAATLLGIAVANPLHAPLVSLRPGESVREILEGPAGIVSVVATPDDLQMRSTTTTCSAAAPLPSTSAARASSRSSCTPRRGGWPSSASRRGRRRAPRWRSAWTGRPSSSSSRKSPAQRAHTSGPGTPASSSAPTSS
jgi:spermidine synthase